MSRSVVFGSAIEQWRVLRVDFEILREAAFTRASDACNGVLLNERGKRADVDAYSLFIGSGARARAYASRELLDHWTVCPRVTFEAFERQTVEQWDGAA